MSDQPDFYCDEVLSGKTPVQKVQETANVLAYHHTRPFYPVHIVVIPKKHIRALVAFDMNSDAALLVELMTVIQAVAAQIVEEHGACRVLTNLGEYQESKHLHWHIISGKELSKEETTSS